MMNCDLYELPGLVYGWIKLNVKCPEPLLEIRNTGAHKGGIKYEAQLYLY